MTTLPAFNTMSMKTIFFIEKSRINQTRLSNATTSSLIIIKLDKAYENGHSSILEPAHDILDLIPPLPILAHTSRDVQGKR